VSESCDFCAIARGDAAAEVVCEGERWVAFFPHHPATRGHTLVIPREHVKDLWAASAAMGAELMEAAIEVGRAIRAALEPDGMNLISSAGAVAEQTVRHLHLHLVPRWEDDGFGPIWPPQTEMPEDVRRDAATRIRAAFGGGSDQGGDHGRRDDERAVEQAERRAEEGFPP
jgi:histidine triad (HIT) family protein